MTNLQKLNRKMLELERNGDISEAEYETYKSLIDAPYALECALGWMWRKVAPVMSGMGEAYESYKQDEARVEKAIKNLRGEGR